MRGSQVVQSPKLLIESGFRQGCRKKGKIAADYLKRKSKAEKFIFETKRSGSVELAELAVEEKHILGVIR